MICAPEVQTLIKWFALRAPDVQTLIKWFARSRSFLFIYFIKKMTFIHSNNILKTSDEFLYKFWIDKPFTPGFRKHLAPFKIEAVFTSSATLVLIAIYLEQFVLCVMVSFLIRTLVKQLADEIKLEREKRAPVLLCAWHEPLSARNNNNIVSVNNINNGDEWRANTLWQPGWRIKDLNRALML